MRAARATVVPMAALMLGLYLATPAAAQTPGQGGDDALQKLLKELDKPETKSEGLSGKPAANRPKGPQEKADQPKSKPAELDEKDRAVDDLLGKLGVTEETPAPEESKPPGANPEPKPGGAGGKDDTLAPQERDLDEHLGELAGKRRKPKDSNQDPGEGQGPLGDLVRQMREVEKRLGEPDTGEQTRQKQEQIVKKLETLIEQARQSQGQSRSMARKSQQPKPGQPKPGNPNGQTPGAMAGNAPNQKPEKPSVKSILGLDKDPWGHLEQHLREEMANVYKEVALPSKEELVKRYYLSVSRKSVSRGE